MNYGVLKRLISNFFFLMASLGGGQMMSERSFNSIPLIEHHSVHTERTNDPAVLRYLNRIESEVLEMLDKREDELTETASGGDQTDQSLFPLANSSNTPHYTDPVARGCGEHLGHFDEALVVPRVDNGDVTVKRMLSNERKFLINERKLLTASPEKIRERPLRPSTNLLHFNEFKHSTSVSDKIWERPARPNRANNLFFNERKLLPEISEKIRERPARPITEQTT